MAGLFYKGGYLPVVGRFIANERIEQYQSEVYNLNDIVNTTYSPSSGKYESMDDANNMYLISYNLRGNSIWDEHQIDLWNEQLAIDFENARKQMSEGLSLGSPFILGNIDGNDYSHKIQRLNFQIYNEERIPAGESRKRAAEIAMKTIDLLGENYNITLVQIGYLDRNGGYTIKMLNNKRSLSYDLLLGNTKRLDDLGENEKKWISELQ